MFMISSTQMLCTNCLSSPVDCGADLKQGDEGPSAPTVSSKSTSSKDAGFTSKEKVAAPSTVSTNSAGASSSTAPLPLDTRTRFGANLFLLSGIELAHVIMKLEQQCPDVLEQLTEEVEVDDNAEKAVSPKLEINIDAIEPALFDELSAYVLERVGTKGHSVHSENDKMDHVSTSSSTSRPKKKKKT